MTKDCCSSWKLPKGLYPPVWLSALSAPEQSPVQDNFSWAKTQWDSELTFGRCSLPLLAGRLYRERHDFQVWVTVFSQQQDLKYHSSRIKNYFQKLSPDDANRLGDLPDLFIWQTAEKDLFEWGSKKALEVLETDFSLLQNSSEKFRSWHSMLLSSFFSLLVYDSQSIFQSWQDISCYYTTETFGFFTPLAEWSEKNPLLFGSVNPIKCVTEYRKVPIHAWNMCHLMLHKYLWFVCYFLIQTFGFLATILCVISMWSSYKVSCITESTSKYRA